MRILILADSRRSSRFGVSCTLRAPSIPVRRSTRPSIVSELNGAVSNPLETHKTLWAGLQSWLGSCSENSKLCVRPRPDTAATINPSSRRGGGSGGEQASSGRRCACRAPGSGTRREPSLYPGRHFTIGPAAPMRVSDASVMGSTHGREEARLRIQPLARLAARA